MDVMELMRARHSVRAYENRPVEEEKVASSASSNATFSSSTGLFSYARTEWRARISSMTSI